MSSRTLVGALYLFSSYALHCLLAFSNPAS
nr:MAG TPA: hypothetical protein [Caudoviricetes sp.]